MRTGGRVVRRFLESGYMSMAELQGHMCERYLSHSVHGDGM